MRSWKIKEVNSVSIQSLSRVWLFVTPWIAARQASLSISNSRNLLKLMSIELVMPCSHLLCRPLLLLPSIPPSIRVFSNESTLYVRWPTYWSFSFSISPSNEHSGLISFRMDWLDLLAVQGSAQDYISSKSELQLLLSYSFSLLSETCSLLSVNLTFNRKYNLADSHKCLRSTFWRYHVVTDWL